MYMKLCKYINGQVEKLYFILFVMDDHNINRELYINVQHNKYMYMLSSKIGYLFNSLKLIQYFFLCVHFTKDESSIFLSLYLLGYFDAGNC